MAYDDGMMKHTAKFAYVFCSRSSQLAAILSVVYPTENNLLMYICNVLLVDVLIM